MQPSPTRKLRLLVGPIALIMILLVVAAPAHAAPLTGTNVEPASLVAGATSTVTVSFTTVTDIPADGKIVVIFPAGFDVSGANGGTCSSMDGTFTTSVAAQTVTLARTPGTIEAAGAETCTVAGIRNPQVSGSTGTYTIRTTDSLDATLDEDTVVAADTITAGALAATNVEPASLVAGATSTVTVTFTTANPIPSDGKVVVIFPAGFDVSGANGATCASMDGTFATSVAAQAVTITRTPGTQEPAGAQTCTIAGIRNPQVSGSTGTYQIDTTVAAGTVIDREAAVAADTITAGALSATNVQPASLVAGATGTVTATFTTANPIPSDGKVLVIFPAGFDASGANGATCSSMDGTFTTSVAGQTVTITRTPGTAEPAGAQTCTIAGIRNPQVSGSTGTYTIRTTTTGDVAIDEDAAVAADTITAGALTATNVQPASLVAGATGTVTATFTTSNPIPADGRVIVIFPAGFDVSGANGGTCSSMDGTFATSVAAQAVTITRTPGTQEPAGAQTCTIAGIRNPQVSGATGTYQIDTANAAGTVIDREIAVSADTITVAVLTSTNVQPATLVAGATGTATVTFTTVNPVPADGKVVVIFPAGFDASGANAGACSSMDGTFATSVAAQTVTITRTPGTEEPAGAQTCTIAGIRNPVSAGATGTYTIRTTNAADAAIDEDTAVAADTITAAALAATDVQPASLVVGTTNTVTVTFTTTLQTPADGKVKVTFPAGFDVSGAAGGACSTMAGTFVTGVAGQVVTITRQNDGAATAAGAQSCTINTIRNPVTAGATGTYAIQTTTAADAVIEQDAAVAADTIVAAASGGGGPGSSTVALGASSNALVATKNTAGGESSHNFSIDVKSFFYGFSIIRITYPEGFIATTNPTTCSISVPSGHIVEAFTIVQPNQIECDIGYVPSMQSGQELAFGIDDIHNPDSPTSGKVFVELVSRGGLVRATAEFPIEVTAGEPPPDPDPSPTTTQGPAGDDSTDPDDPPAATTTPPRRQPPVDTGTPDEDTPGLGLAVTLMALTGLLAIVRVRRRLR